MIQTSMPPPAPAAPSFQYHPGGGAGTGNPTPPHFRGYQPVVYNGKPTMNQEEYDGKRLRKSSMRKTVDYNCSAMKYLEDRIWMRGALDRPALQPDVLFYPELLPPAGIPDNPINAVTTRFVRTATNKMRCPIFCLAWTPEGRRLITGASSGEFTLWNGLTFNFETILQAHDSPVRTMIWSRNDQWMVTGDHGGYIKYWQMNMNNVKMFQAHKDPLRGISFSPSDHKLATCSDDGTVRIWDFIRCYEEKVLRGHGADVKCVDWHPYKGLVVSGSKDNQQPVRLWDPKSGQSLATLHAHKSTVMDLKFNRNGNWLLTGSRDHLIKLFDIRNLSEEVQIFRGHKREAASLSWHPIHETLFSSGGSDGSMMFWNVGCDKEVGCIEQAHDSLIWSMSWHPLGHVLASGSNDHTTKFWTRNRPGDSMNDKYNLNIGDGDGGAMPGGRRASMSEDPAEDGADGPGGAEAPVIPGMGPDDRVEPPAGKTDEEGKPTDGPSPANTGPGAPPLPDGDRRFPLRRPPWRFASHWNERWLHHEDSSAGDDRGGWRGGRGGWRGRGRGPMIRPPFDRPPMDRPPLDRDREDIKAGDDAGRHRDGPRPRDGDDQAARDADMRPAGDQDRDRDMRDRDMRDRDMRDQRGGRFGGPPPMRGRGGPGGWGRDDDQMQTDPPNGVHDGPGGPPNRGRGAFRGDRGGFRGGFRGGDRPGMDRPGMDRPGMDRPGMDRPGMDGPRDSDERRPPGPPDGWRADRGRGGPGNGPPPPQEPGGWRGRGGSGAPPPRDEQFHGRSEPPPPLPPPDDRWRGRDNAPPLPRDEGWRGSGPGAGGPPPPLPDDHWRGRGGRGGGPSPNDSRGGGRGSGPPPSDGWRGSGPGSGGPPPQSDGWRGSGSGAGLGGSGPPPPQGDNWRGGSGAGPPPQGGISGGPPLPSEDGWRGGAGRGNAGGSGPPQEDSWRGDGLGGPPPPPPPPEDGWMNRCGRGSGMSRGGGGSGPPPEDGWRGGGRGGAGFRGRGFRDEDRGGGGGGGWRGGGRSRGGRPPRGF